MSATPPGWYPDPERGQDAERWWDGKAWTAHVAEHGAIAEPGDESRNWAVIAHLSAIGALVVALTFVGPLCVYVLKADDPFVRDQATEALNFQLSAMLWLAVTMLGVLFVLGPILAAFYAFAWLTCVVSAAIRAGQGEAHRYPLTIRFVR